MQHKTFFPESWQKYMSFGTSLQDLLSIFQNAEQFHSEPALPFIFSESIWSV